MSHLHVRVVPFDNRINNDAGSGAKQDLATWKPVLPAGWYYLGPGANNGAPTGTEGVIVRPAGERRVLAPVTRWEQVWNDAGSGKSTNYALWRGLPSEADSIDFVVIGGFFTRSHNPPSTGDAEGMVAIHKDLLINARPGREVWNDAGTGARLDGAVWDISTEGILQAIGTGAFIPVLGHNNPPRTTYALNRDKVKAAF